MKRICIFCGARAGRRPIYQDLARQVGIALTRRNWGVIYGAGSIGLMGELADAALEAGGHVTGVIPETLLQKEQAHSGLSELHVVGSMHERKALMAELADGFLALPGGVGTLEELVEILTWAQLGFHDKPVGLLDGEGYFEAFLTFLDHAVEEGFLGAADRSLLRVSRYPDVLLDSLEDGMHPSTADAAALHERT